MSGVVHGLVLDRRDLLEVARLIRIGEHARQRNGLPIGDRLARLKLLVADALADEQTPAGQRKRLRLTTSEYAARMGCSNRTAHRYAQRHGIREGGRWYIEIEE